MQKLVHVHMRLDNYGCRNNTKGSLLDVIYTQIDTVHSLSLLPFPGTIVSTFYEYLSLYINLFWQLKLTQIEELLN